MPGLFRSRNKEGDGAHYPPGTVEILGEYIEPSPALDPAGSIKHRSPEEVQAELAKFASWCAEVAANNK